MTKGVNSLLEVLFVSAVCLVSFLFVRGHEIDDAPTSDEGYHLFAGAEYVDDGTYWVNLEHPPLLKNFAGLALRPLHLPTPSMGKAPLDHTPHNNYIRFLYGAPVPADRIVSAARRPFPWLLVLLVVVVYVVTRQVFGIAAAPLAAGLIALEPSFVANASIVHTDVGAALTMTATIALGLWAARRRHVVCWLAVGLALGLALATKFSAVILVPAVLSFPVYSWLVEKPRAPWSVFRERLLGAAVAVGFAFLTLAAVYAIDMRRMPRDYAREAVRLHLAGRGANAETIERYARFSDFSAPLGHYLAGLKGVALFSQNGRGANYFHGRVSQSGFLLYFPVAFLIKTTPALLAIVFLIPI
ncbi:MAG TPA: phospholipid carrier-dependent glycosyltransferase, partial [Thermoanaerobaculia bacterium]|nr:phospholipid carrier-dependent glycosyltransferase [Thermoanaerobaculia bacterium]